MYTIILIKVKSIKYIPSWDREHEERVVRNDTMMFVSQAIQHPSIPL